MITPLVRLIPATLVTIVMIASGASAMAVELTPSQPERKSAIEAQNVGVFTGKIINGMPLYQLPSITVVGHRKVELAKLKREEQLARSKQVRVKAAIKGPA
jgi:hypothetical protein